MKTEAGAVPFAIPASGDDAEMAALIESWRYTGPPTEWSAIVGHGPQIRRAQELVEKLSRSEAELARLRLRVGAGMVIAGPAGVGKTLMARALAAATGRMVIAPPVAELNAGLIARLYAQLAKAAPSVVILDEAESLIGPAFEQDDAAARALLAALDGVNRPQHGPITLALTTTDVAMLDAAATRPGRLAPHLVLERPSPDERRELLARAIEGLPGAESIELLLIVERTGGWTGAELAGAVAEACSRSLLDHSDALRMDLLVEVVDERFTVLDDHPVPPTTSRTAAIHEAGHALFGELVWPGRVAVCRLDHSGGRTILSDELLDAPHDAAELHRLAALSQAGRAAEQLVLGAEHWDTGSALDISAATGYLADALAAVRHYDVGQLERGSESDRGSERMRAALHAEMEAAAAATFAAALGVLAPHAEAIERLADALLAAPGQVLSGDDLRAATAAALGR
jgi:cell division protease FtsH